MDVALRAAITLLFCNFKMFEFRGAEFFPFKFVKKNKSAIKISSINYFQNRRGSLHNIYVYAYSVKGNLLVVFLCGFLFLKNHFR